MTGKSPEACIPEQAWYWMFPDKRLADKYHPFKAEAHPAKNSFVPFVVGIFVTLPKKALNAGLCKDISAKRKISYFHVLSC
jgi:hypothetical protein